MRYRFEEVEIKSVAGLLSKLKNDESRLRREFRRERSVGPKVWFRGLRDIKNQQVPSFYLKGYRVQDEVYHMNLFKQNSHELLVDNPNGEWDWMFLMRHHNSPSRLLDWTENPLVGLYFAVRPREKEHNKAASDGVLWSLLPTCLNRWSLKWPIDDANLPMFTENPAEYSRGENEAILLYLPSKMKTLSEKATLPPAAGMCIRTNRRMQVQMGVFTIHHADRKPIEDVGDGTHMWRYRIPEQYKQSMAFLQKARQRVLGWDHLDIALQGLRSE